MTDEQQEFNTVGEALAYECKKWGSSIGQEGLAQFTEEVRSWPVPSDQMVNNIPIRYEGYEGKNILMRARLH